MIRSPTSDRSLSDAEIAQLLRDVETTFDLFEPSVDGWSAWQLLRFSAAARLVRPASTPFGAARTWRRSELVGSVFADWARYVRLPKTRLLAKSFASALVEVQADGRYRDVFFDDVLDAVGDHIKIEAQNTGHRDERSRLAHFPPSCTTVGIEVLATTLSRLKPSREITEVAGFLSDVIMRELGISGFEPERVERRLQYFRLAKRLYGRILDRVRPELVLVADTSEFELFAAAKERNVRCVELQHGIFTRDHPDALGAAAARHRERVIVPDALLLFGEYWKEELGAGGFYRDELRATGSPRLDRFRASRAAGVHRDKRVCKVLVTSQGVALEKLARFIVETVSLASADGFECRVDIKLHPFYDALSRPVYESVVGGVGEIRVLASEQQPSTLALLSAADAHVSISSACHYEALGLGVPTIVLALPGYEQVVSLVEAGHAVLAETPAELARLLPDVRDMRVSDHVSAGYYRPGALDRIVAELGCRPGDHPCS